MEASPTHSSAAPLIPPSHTLKITSQGMTEIREDLAGEKLLTMTLDGEIVEFVEGESIYDVANRHRKEVPTLCYDDRLEAFGACRLCVVEVEGIKNPVASCTTVATEGMSVKTHTETIEKHRKTLLELVVSENRNIEVDELSGYSSQEMVNLVDRYDARSGRFQGKLSGTSNEDDKNPFILRDYDNCISC